jgi:hypothetical protein
MNISDKTVTILMYNYTNFLNAKSSFLYVNSQITVRITALPVYDALSGSVGSQSVVTLEVSSMERT